MRGRHHASSDTTVTYRPKAEAQPAGPGGGPVDLAYSAVCHFCDVTHISVIKPFPIPYRCSTCAATHRGAIPVWAGKSGPTPAQVALLTHIEKAAERIAKITDRLEVERERRDDLFVKAQGIGLTSREIGAAASMSSPGVVGAWSRARAREVTRGT